MQINRVYMPSITFTQYFYFTYSACIHGLARSNTLWNDIIGSSINTS